MSIIDRHFAEPMAGSRSSGCFAMTGVRYIQSEFIDWI